MGKTLKIDFWLLLPAIILILTGLTTMTAINPLYLKSQSFALLIGSIIFIILSQIDYRIFKNTKLLLYVSALVLLSIVFIIGIESRGATRWIELFGVRIQFSETLKPVLSLALAAHISDQEKPRFKSFLFTTILLIPLAMLIHLQPDLGNALIYVSVYFLVLASIGFPVIWTVLTVLLPSILVSPLIWTLLHEYQRQRVITFLNPSADPLGTSYNSIQALIAVGSGLILGKGLGEGTQSALRFLPERHTDFIFASLSEGMGFVGGLIIIIAFTFLLYRIYIIYKNSEGIFEKIFLLCSFYFLFIQYGVNIGMNIGIVPVVGVTLPFVSFGGSSLVANFIFLAIISSISISHQKRTVLEIK
jgi:rod shape determining protein RodA